MIIGNRFIHVQHRLQDFGFWGNKDSSLCISRQNLKHHRPESLKILHSVFRNFLVHQNVSIQP